VAILSIFFGIEGLYVGKDTVVKRATDLSFMAALTYPFLGFAIYLAAALLGGDAISGDFGARTGYYTLVLPLRRVVLFLGRYLAAILATIVVILIYYAYALVQTVVFFGTVPGLETLQSLGIALIFAAAAMGLAFFFSSLTKSPTISIVLTVLVFFILLPVAVGIVSGLTDLNPWWSLTSAVTLITLPFGEAARGGALAGMWIPTYAQGIGIIMGYLAAFTLVGYFLYEYKESSG
jgi:ABC-type transport system involved in multi-copper enzyme maturation permease subunit